MEHQTKKTFLIFSVLAVALVTVLIVIGFHLFPTQKTDEKPDEGKMLPMLGSISVRENNSFPLSFYFLTNNGSNFEFLNPAQDLQISTDAKNIRIEKYEIQKSAGENPYVYSIQTSCLIEGTDPVELKKLMIQTETNEYTFDIGNIKLHPYPDSGVLNPDDMKIMSNRGASHNAGIGDYDAEYINEGIHPAVVKQIRMDPDFEAFHPQVYLNDQLIPDPQNVNISIPPKGTLNLFIQFDKTESPYDVFCFAPAILLESSTELHPSYAVSGTLVGHKEIQSLYDKYFKG